MKRSTRKDLAEQTVEIVERGSYVAASGRPVDIQSSVRACMEATRLFLPAELERLKQQALAGSEYVSDVTIEVVDETTLAGLARLQASGTGRIGVLNFASAKNPGGGFLNGSQAQEESLARSSALHASLLTQWGFYERHRASPTLLYSDEMILSPDCPVFRDDEGLLLDAPRLATFISSPAPNAGAAADSRPEEVSQIPDVFRRRSEYVLALAAAHGIERLVLGAWGCGVFRNDPFIVAGAFAAHLVHGNWANRFKQVRFSVLDTSPGQETILAFKNVVRHRN
jgi:uncharacterized protein (TIGR02452 family)